MYRNEDECQNLIVKNLIDLIIDNLMCNVKRSHNLTKFDIV